MSGMGKELWRCSSSQLSSLYSRRECSPVEVALSCLERIESLNPTVNPMVLVARDAALAAAKASETRMHKSELLGDLDGVPYTVKDNLFVAQLPATWGSMLFREFIAPNDEIAVERMKAAGAILLGKTNTPEFALGSQTDNRPFGRTYNPWNSAVTSGGSSGGAAVATATQMAPLALATDAGGSTRTPASYNGLFGLRPSTGAIPRVGGFPPLAHDFQVVGLITRAIEDLIQFFRCVSGPDLRDQASVYWGGTRASSFRGAIRMCWTDACGDSPVDPQVKEAVRRAAEHFESLGCEVRRDSLPIEPSDVAEIWTVLSSVGAARIAVPHPNWEERVTPDTAAVVRRGLEIRGTTYLRAVDEAKAFRTRVQERWKDCDVFLTPTSAALPWSWKEGFPGAIDGKKCAPRAASIFATWVNAAGLPALNIPAAISNEGLPIGIQLVGPYGSDEAILELANRYSQIAPLGLLENNDA